MPRLLLVFSCLLVLTACEPDVADTATLLPGRWELTTAKRDNMETQMLDGLYYYFGEDGTLETNLRGNENTGSFQLAEQAITTTGIIPELTYDIVEISDSTLHLRTALQGFRFDFELKRK